MTNQFPKSPKRVKIEWALAFLGLGALIAEIFQTPEDKQRNAVTEVLTDLDVFTEKDWVAQPDACEFCQDAAANSPYPIDASMESHKNCRCEWWPRRTTVEVPGTAYDEETPA
jgi:hypothetical protein